MSYPPINPQSGNAPPNPSDEPHISSRAPIQDFTIDYNQVNQSFTAIKRGWQHAQRPPIERVQWLLSWARVNSGGELQLWGQKFADLWYSKLDIGNDDDWFFTQALGRGGFGAVALFEKHNEQTAMVEDQIVVKTTEIKPFLAVADDRMDLPSEAALMGQTNDIDDDGMLKLRNFKTYSLQRQWRFYFEYCPYGDLERLRVRYKAYGLYLPELFLWHTFYWLAKTVQNYKSDVWRSTDTATWGDRINRSYLVHSDIKPQNVLLGPPDPQTSGGVSLYPIPRMADLGLAEILKTHDVNSAAVYHHNGTPDFKPPETRFDEVRLENDFYPFDHPMYLVADKTHPFRKGYHPVTSKTNLWAIGAVMFSLTSLRESGFIWRRVRRMLRERRPVPQGPNESIITDDDFRIIAPKYYSQELRDLIKDCLKFRPQDRPSEDALMTRVTNGYMTNLQTLRHLGFSDDGDGNGNSDSDNNSGNSDHNYTPSFADAVNSHPDYMLYYVENEIDDAPDNEHYEHPDRTDDWWTHDFVSDTMWVPPEWGRLWPDDMPIDVEVPMNWPTGYQVDFERTRAAIYQEPVDPVLRRQQQAEQRQADYLALNPGAVQQQQQQQPVVQPQDPVAAPGPGHDGAQDQARSVPAPARANLGGFVAINTDAGARAAVAGRGAGGQARGAAPDVTMANDGNSDSVGDLTAFPRVAGPVRQSRITGRYQPYFIPRRGGRR